MLRKVEIGEKWGFQVACQKDCFSAVKRLSLARLPALAEFVVGDFCFRELQSLWLDGGEGERKRGVELKALRTLSVGNESMPMCKFICVTGWDACCRSLTGPLECNVNVGNGAFREKVIVKQSGEKGSVDWKKYLDDIVLVYLCLFIRMVSR